MSFPQTRPRRLRRSPALRRMVRETQLSVDDFIYPMFITEGEGVRNPVSSMPEVFQLSIDEALKEIEEVAALGIPMIDLFGIPRTKDLAGKHAIDEDGLIPQAVRAIKERFPELLVMTDVCLCGYTDHGHCGLLNGSSAELTKDGYSEGYVLNDETLEVLAKIAVSHAQAGADIVAPSGMIDGMVGAIRAGLDSAGLERVAILSYAIKYASAFYGPFREAAEGAPKHGDRRSHQMDPPNTREALREAAFDVEEGADILMVKPALPYLDVIQQTRTQFPELPLAAYNVSGEYAMVKAAAANRWLDERSTVTEVLTAIKRAGADLIITYHAKEFATWLRS